MDVKLEQVLESLPPAIVYGLKGDISEEEIENVKRLLIIFIKRKELPKRFKTKLAKV